MCYGEYGAKVLTHSCTKRLQRQLAESIYSALASLPTIPNHHTGDVILPSHVTYPPFDRDALIDAQLGLTLRPALMNSGHGLTGLAPRRRVLQRQHGLSHGLDEVDARVHDSDDDLSQFNYSCLYVQCSD